jgi:hypothetical protein
MHLSIHASFCSLSGFVDASCAKVQKLKMEASWGHSRRVLGGKPEKIETRWQAELDLEELPRVLGGPGRFLGGVPRGFKCSVGRGS